VILAEISSIRAGLLEANALDIPVDVAKRIVDLFQELDAPQIPGNRHQRIVLENMPRRSARDAPIRYSPDVFFIPDHEHILGVFHDDLPVLVLTPRQADKLKPLFLAANLESRFLSTSVQETQSATDRSMVDMPLSEDLQSRASALFR
jgi:hypothetical protein